MEGIYKINLVPSDLSTEETILQIADTLDNLNGVVEDVFTRFLGRIKQNMDKTNKLNERIDTSRKKVEALTGMQKAIKVFSSAKYPAAVSHTHYQSVFDLDGYRHKPKAVALSGKALGLPNDKEIQEKLHFYHVKVAPPKSLKPKQDFNLNIAINNVTTVGELLVFNSNESPYLGTSEKVAPYTPKLADVENTNLLEEAPSSIMKRDVLKREVDEYMYAPGMGMVPELEMPLDLPHLPGIAGDVQFSITTDGSIAPSVVTSPVAPVAALPEELPDFKELPDVKLPDFKELNDVKLPVGGGTEPDAPPPVMAPPPQALPPPPPVPPPPPPPPQMEAVPQPKGKLAGKPAPAAPAPAPAGDARSNLMEAIRQAGGAGRAKLRSTTEATLQTGGKPSSGGDLMADLHAKLSMRRRGISGAERGSVLHTLASVIPEPTGDQSSPQPSSSDNDWE